MTERTDRELLELAAKAAGKKVRIYEGMVVEPGTDCVCVDQRGFRWNPLEDDGDALRLAVKLGINITAYPIYNTNKHSVVAQKKLPLGSDPEEFWFVVAYGDNPRSATRRAIVECAAAMAEGGEQ
ncbi:MAG: hypothetical protein K0U78_13655 [Actinomycetia bacterium]|nr:hypothetical protein [Actinomycetes bacterium]